MSFKMIIYFNLFALPNSSPALQHGGFVLSEYLAAKGLLYEEMTMNILTYHPMKEFRQARSLDLNNKKSPNSEVIFKNFGSPIFFCQPCFKKTSNQERGLT